MKKLTKVLMSFVVALLVATPVANAVVLISAADATITEAFPAQDTTAWSVVIVQTNNIGLAGLANQSMIKFDIAGSGLTVADVVDVKLRLYVTQFDQTGGGARDFVTQVRENTLDFDEGAGFPTWNTHSSSFGSTVYGQLTTLGNNNGGPSPLGWYEIDLDPTLVKGWIDGSITNNGLHLYGNNNNWRTYNPRFSSRQGANAPELVITPEPASLALFGLGGLLMLKRRR